MNSFFKYSAIFFIIIGFGYFLAATKSFFIPLVIAIFIWYLILVIAGGYKNIIKKIPSWLALVMSLLTIFVVLWFFGLIINGNINEVVKAAPEYQARFQNLIDKTSHALNIGEPIGLKEIKEKINIPTLVGSIATMLKSIASYTGAVLIYVLLLLIEYRIFDNKLRIIFFEKKDFKRIKEVFARIDLDIKTYIKIKSLMSFLTAILSYIVLLLVGVDFAMFWALIIFLLNYIPTVGSVIAIIFPLVLVIIQFGSFSSFLVVMVSLIAIQVAIGNILEPKLMAKSLNLSSLVIVLSLVIWGNIWGIVGMFLSIPIMVIINIVLSNFPKTRSLAIMLSSNGEIKNV